MAAIQKVVRKTGVVKWTVVYDDPRAIGKRAQRRRSFDTEREAKKFAAQFEIQRQEGTFVEPSKVRLAEFLDQYLQAAKLKPSSKHTYRNKFTNHVIPQIGNLPISKITTLTVQRLINDLVKEGYKPKTIISLYGGLSGAFDQAVAWKMLPSNPCHGLILPRVEKADPVIWTPEQVRLFLQETRGHHHWLMWKLALHTGLRVGEAVALRWQDVDLEKGQIRIAQTETHNEHGGIDVGEPKSEMSKRTIPLSPDLVADLKHQRREQNLRRLKAEEWADRDVVFDSTLRPGMPFRSEGVNQCLRRVVNRLGLPPISFHGMRHTHATTLMAARIPARVVQERLGHSNVAITLGLYSHVTEQMQEEATTVIAQLFEVDQQRQTGD